MILSLGGEGTETSPLGYSYHPITGEWKGHTGVDFWGLMQERRFLLPLMGLWLMQDGSGGVMLVFLIMVKALRHFTDICLMVLQWQQQEILLYKAIK
jgi:hypothetical protein